MSRREGRDSGSRRHRSRFDREPSPKRSRRDGKPESERVVSNTDVGDRADQDEKQRRRLQDALPLEHDEHGNAAQTGQSFGRRAAIERGWWRDTKDQHNERETKTYETRQRDEKPQAKGDDNGDWRHDRFFEMEADPPPLQPPTRKRPAFSEKIPATTQSTDNTTKEPEKASHSGHRVLGSERRVDRDRNPRHLDRQDRITAGVQVPNRREAPRGRFLSHERHGGGGGNFRARDRFSGRQGYHSGGTRVEKWKHDLFDEANKSPPRKNEDDQIAKVESLLAS